LAAEDFDSGFLFCRCSSTISNPYLSPALVLVGQELVAVVVLGELLAVGALQLAVDFVMADQAGQPEAA
jgi:hypothetical protein